MINLITLTLVSLFLVQIVNDITKYQMFLSALGNDSTSPNYILITVTNLTDNKTKEICTLASFLEGAVHIEKHIAYGRKSLAKVKNILMKQRDLHFSFKKKEALDNIGFDEYNEKDISRIANLYNIEWIIKLVHESGKLMFTFKGNSKEQIYFAKSLLLKGIMVRSGCIAGNLLSLELFTNK